MDNQFSTLQAEVKAAFEAYLTANGSVRDRARLHGEALVRLRAACAERKLDFVGKLKELGEVVSTAYHHISLSECWDQAVEMSRTKGVDFDALSIAEVIGLVKPRKRKPVESAAGVASDQSHTPGNEASLPALTNGTPDEVFAQVSPSVPPAALLSPLTAPAQPATPVSQSAPPSTIQNLIDLNLVRVIHVERGRSVEVEVGDRPVLVVPR